MAQDGMTTEVLEDPVDETSESYKPIRTFPYLTKYEKARILGVRATHIANGAPISGECNVNEKDPLVLAEEELRRGKTPLIIRRWLPDGTYEDVHVVHLLRFDKKT